MIKDTQRSLVQKRFIMEELKKGNYPSVSLIEGKVNEYFKVKRAGIPRFTHKEFTPHEVSNAKDYNQMFHQIKEDLVVGFEEIKTLNNQIMTLANYYDSNRIKVERELKRLELKSEALMQKSMSRSQVEIVEDSVSDFSMTEFKGDESRNIPKTTAFIDLRYGEVSLNTQRNSFRKHDLSDADIKLKSLNKDGKVLHIAPLQNAFVDHIHDSWRSIISTKNAEGAAAELTIELKEPVYATHLAIVTQSGKPFVGTLFISENGEKYTEFERRKLTTNYQWVFNRQKVRFIRLQLEKQEEDYVNGMDYEYLFGAKLIELKEQLFQDEAVFVSKPFEIPSLEAIQTVTLDAVDYLPANTSIRYYVGLDYDNNMIEWQELQKGVPLPMGMTKPYSFEINSFSEGYGEPLYSQFGNAFYRIAKLPHKPLPKTIQLMLGRNMWVKETISSNDLEDQTVLYQTSMRDWVRVGTPRKEYLTIDQNNDFLEANTFHRYTTNIYVEESIIYTIGVTTTPDTTKAVYVNNGQIKEVDGKYQLQLRKGWNKVQILTHTKEQAQEIVFDIYFREISNQIFAFYEPLEEVSLYHLLHNTSSRMHNRFAIDEDCNLIVNYDPKALDIMRTGIEYAVSYQYSTESNQEHKIRFMALLSKDGNDIVTSPRLHQYQLTIE